MERLPPGLICKIEDEVNLKRKMGHKIVRSGACR